MGRPVPAISLPRLASPFCALKERYDVVVVGSGYGGGIAAARLAHAGLEVCVLERGLERHPGEYPSSLGDAPGALQMRFRNQRIGKETSLFDFRVGDGISVLVGCGLGGTSLINANVCIDPSDWVFDDPVWPIEIRNDVGGRLQDGMQRARDMLTPSQCPVADADGRPVQKLAQLRAEAAAIQGATFKRPDLAVTFDNVTTNPAGIEQPPCRMCGDCISGCNYGAKNTVLMNYLPWAKKCGAHIFTEICVDWVECLDQTWLVRFRRVGSGAGSFAAPHRFVRADRVVLAAGTLGSTEILHRSAQKGRSASHPLLFSDRIGERFSGNGDVLAFAYNAREPVNGLGLGEERLDDHPPVGPCIAGLIDVRDGQRGNGMIIEDGSPPGAIAKIMPGFLALLRGFSPRFRATRRQRARARWDRLRSRLSKPYRGAVLKTQTHLVMAHDRAAGELTLSSRGRLQVSYPDVGKEPIFKRIDNNLDRAAKHINAVHLPNPLWDRFWWNPVRRLYRLARMLRRQRWGQGDLLTVHPLGGCAMADDAERGVVNHRQQVFSGKTGDRVHPGLFVCDGSVIPRALGVNPLITISGLAERAVEYILDDDGRRLAPTLDSVPLWKEEKPPRTLGFRFTERLVGWVHVPAPGQAPEPDYGKAEAIGKSWFTELDVVLDMEIDDLDEMIDGEQHEIRCSGVVRLPVGLGYEAMAVAGTKARILKRSNVYPHLHTMEYEVEVVGPDGARFRIVGEKWVTDHFFKPLLWKQVTTLYTRVYDSNGNEVARGIIYVRFWDFVKQLLTQRTLKARSLVDWVAGWFQFNTFFLRQMFGAGVAAIPPAERVDQDAEREPRKLEVDPDTVTQHAFSSRDGVELRLTRYLGGEKGPVLLVHGLGVSSRIFSIDTIDTNLVEFLYAADYDVWLLDYRASTELPHACYEQFSADDVAKYDLPAAIDAVLELTKRDDLQLMVHCFGATCFFMSALGDHIKPAKIRSAVVSQIATHLITSLDTRLKAGAYLAKWGSVLGLRYLNPYTDSAARRPQRLWNFLLRFLPMPRDERCRSDVCRRISSLYSLLYEHTQLNRETHAALHEMLGAANMRAFEHLAEMSRQGKIVDANGEDVYVPHMKTRLNFPIRFIHGARNYCYKPESTRITIDLLEELQADVATNLRQSYDRHVIPGYGHIDCIFGRNAARDVYPKILEHLDSHTV